MYNRKENRNFQKILENQWSRGNFLCIGLDSEFSKIPESARRRGNNNKLSVSDAIVKFNREIVEATKDIICAYKPNTAFYEANGAEGIIALQRTIEDIHAIAPDVLVILDAKRADIGNTNTGYVKFAFKFLRADAITVNPYLGTEALKPFLDKAEKGIFILCRTSNPGAGEFQDLPINGEPLYSIVARRVANECNKNNNCGLVVGATYPEELCEIRKIAGNMPILVPGIGAQGGDIKKTITACKDSRGQGMIISSSRNIIFASSGVDFAKAARRETEKLRNIINQYRIN